MKRFFILLGMAFCMLQGHAQHLDNKPYQHALDKYRKAVRADFDDFREQVMKEYADFVSNPWKEFDALPPIPMPKCEPAPPVVMPDHDKGDSIEDNPIIIDTIVNPLPPDPQPTPIEPIEEVPVLEDKYVSFTFYGTSVKVRFDISNKPYLRKIDERSVADAFNGMRPEDYDNMVIDCLNMRNTLCLSDWAYLQLLKQLSAKIVGEAQNEKTLVLAYLYMKSGYRMRLASDGENLYMLYSSKHYIYNQVSYCVDNEFYYGVDNLPSKLFICEASFPGETNLSLIIRAQHRFDYLKTTARSIISEKYPELKVDVAVNKNLIDFYNTYPTSMLGEDFMTRWAMYAETPMEQNIQSSLYPQLRNVLKDMSQYEAVSRLLDFVQTGFIYEYDDKVWGYDRAFFAEESLYYPYCDCEDRSILFSRLVRDIIGLDVILVYYPGHLAAAVNFSQNVNGDYISLAGKKYVICDPTYIGAPVGRTMPNMDNSKASVIIIGPSMFNTKNNSWYLNIESDLS